MTLELLVNGNLALHHAHIEHVVRVRVENLQCKVVTSLIVLIFLVGLGSGRFFCWHDREEQASSLIYVGLGTLTQSLCDFIRLLERGYIVRLLCSHRVDKLLRLQGL